MKKVISLLVLFSLIFQNFALANKVIAEDDNFDENLITLLNPLKNNDLEENFSSEIFDPKMEEILEEIDIELPERLKNNSKTKSIQKISTKKDTITNRDAGQKSGNFYGIDWEITTDGILKLGKSGTTQNLQIPEQGFYNQVDTDDGHYYEYEFPWYQFRSEITQVDFVGQVKVKGWLTGFFNGLYNVTEIKNINNLDTSDVTNMCYMFYNMYSLKNLDLSSFDTNNVTNISRMFHGNYSLETLNLSNFDTSKVTDINGMFFGTRSLKSLDLSSFDTSNVYYMNELFDSMNSLEQITLGEKWTKWQNNAYLDENVSQKTWKNGNLVKTSKELYNEYTNNISTYKGTWTLDSEQKSGNFYGMDWEVTDDGILKLGKLMEAQNLEIRSGFYTNSYVFPWYKYRNEIIQVDFVGQVKAKGKIEGLFEYLTKVTAINNISNLDTSEVTSMRQMFYYMTSIVDLDLSSFNTSNVTDMAGMFADAYSLENINLSSFDTSKVEYMNWMFQDMYSLDSLDLSNFDTRNVTHMNGMFFDSFSIDELDLSSFDTRNVTHMNGMFSGMDFTKSINISNFDTGKVEDMTNMFKDTKYLEEITLGPKFTKWQDLAYLDENLTNKKTWKLETNQNLKKTSEELYNEYPSNASTYKGTWILDSAQNTTLHSGTFNGLWWEITEAGELILGKKGQTHTLKIEETDQNLTINVAGTKLDEIFYYNFPWSEYRANIVKVTVAGKVILEGYTGGLFSNLYRARSINGLANLDTKNAISLDGMFYNTAYIDKLDVSSFNTSNVIDMRIMFFASGVEGKLDLSNFDTSKVERMDGMFSGAEYIESLDLSSFDTGKVTNMSNMFYGLNSLNQITLGEKWTKWTDEAYLDEGLDNSKHWIHTENSSLKKTSEELYNEYTNNISTYKGTWKINDKIGNFAGMDYLITDDGELILGKAGKTQILQLSNLDVYYLMKTNYYGSEVLDIYYFAYPWLPYASEIKKITFAGNVIGKGNMSGLFDGLYNVKTIENFTNFDTSYVENMMLMFSGMYSLENLNVSHFDTSKVKNMAGTFSGLMSLKNLDLSNFDTKNVTNMAYMFYRITGVDSLDLSNFNTGKVTNMINMFYGISSLKNLNISSFRTSEVTDMSGMFYGTDLKNLDVSRFNTAKVTDMNHMFSGMSSLESLDLSNFNTSNVTDMNSMFDRTYSLKNLNISNFDTSKVTNMSGMFYSSALENLDLSHFNTSNVTDMSYMFAWMDYLTNLNISSFDTKKVTDTNHMFSGMSSLKNLNISNLNTENVVDMSSMFASSASLENLNLSNFNTEKTTNMNNMFYGTSSLKTLNISSFNTAKVTDMNSMFAGSGLENLDLSNFDTKNVKFMEYMFSNMTSLKNLNISNFNTENVENMSGMFSGTNSLENLDLSHFDTKNVTYMTDMFFGMTALKNLNLANFDTSNVSLMDYIFYKLQNLEKITLGEKWTKRMSKTYFDKGFKDERTYIHADSGLIKTSTDIYLNYTSNIDTYKGTWLLGYKITYDLDGGVLSQENPEYYSKKSNFTLNNPTKNGYEFTGWTTPENSNPSKNITIKKGTSGEKTFIANFKKSDNPTPADTEAPHFSRNGMSVTLNVGDSYDYNKYKPIATDSIDGNIEVIRIGEVDTSKAGTYTIIWSATDKAGNKATITDTIEVKAKDTTAPKFSRNGKNTTIYVGDNYDYDEPTATDNVDGKVLVTKSGEVDTSKAGTYTIVWSATDKAGNKTTLTDKVTVKEKGTSSGRKSYAPGIIPEIPNDPRVSEAGKKQENEEIELNSAPEKENNNSTNFLKDFGFARDSKTFTFEIGEKITYKKPSFYNKTTQKTTLKRETGFNLKPGTYEVTWTLVSENGEKKSLTDIYILKNSQEKVLDNSSSVCKSFSKILGEDNADYKINFSDYDKAENKDAFYKLVKAGIIKGTKNGLLEPDRNMTKQEFLGVALSIYCFNDASRDFENIDSWEEKVKNIGVKLGIVDKDFYGQAPIDKVDALKIIINIGKATNKPVQIKDLAIFRETNSFATRDYYAKLFIDIIKLEK